MNINELLREYRQVKVSNPFNEQKIKSTLDSLGDAIFRGTPDGETGTVNFEVQWQKEMKEVLDNADAMIAFYEMYVRGVRGVTMFSAILAFHFANKVIAQALHPRQIIETAYTIRAIVSFDYLDEFDNYLKRAREEKYYKGILDGTEYFDSFMLYNAYQGWSNLVESPKFEKLKQMTPKAERLHPHFNKVDYNKNGNEISDALARYIENRVLTNPHIPKYFKIRDSQHR